MNKNSCLSCVLALMMLMVGCGRDHSGPEISGVKLNFRFNRFEKDLFNRQDKVTTADVSMLRGKYGEFFDLFCENMIRIGNESDSAIAAGLTMYIRDPEVLNVQTQVDSVFKDTRILEQDLEKMLRHLKYYFPEKPEPAVVTYNAVFNYAVVTTDSVMGIGLDMFLGEQEESYSRIGLPRYIFQRFTPAYIVPSCAKGWFQSEYDPSHVKGDLISQMIYQGKMLYFTQSVIPEIADTLNTGYTSSQLKWCEGNESDIWAFFIDKKLLFNTDPSEYVKYINDGPTTSGFPPESPGKIGSWIGLQIVNKYMEEHPQVTLDSLLKTSDALKILEHSKYKPKRST
jgi:gliding motility-associated lipoprotein GldB